MHGTGDKKNPLAALSSSSSGFGVPRVGELFEGWAGGRNDRRDGCAGFRRSSCCGACIDRVLVPIGGEAVWA